MHTVKSKFHLKIATITHTFCFFSVPDWSESISPSPSSLDSWKVMLVVIVNFFFSLLLCTFPAEWPPPTAVPLGVAPPPPIGLRTLATCCINFFRRRTVQSQSKKDVIILVYNATSCLLLPLTLHYNILINKGHY